LGNGLVNIFFNPYSQSLLPKICFEIIIVKTKIEGREEESAFSNP